MSRDRHPYARTIYEDPGRHAPPYVLTIGVALLLLAAFCVAHFLFRAL